MHPNMRAESVQERRPEVVVNTSKATGFIEQCQASILCPQPSSFPYDVETPDLWIDLPWITRQTRDA